MKPLSQEVAELLRCPITGQTLKRVAKEKLEDFDGEFPEGGYLTADGSLVYPIENAFPVLVEARACRLRY